MKYVSYETFKNYIENEAPESKTFVKSYIEGTGRVIVLDLDGISMSTEYGLGDTEKENDYQLNIAPHANNIPIFSPTTRRPEVVVVEPEGDGESIPSHNYMDKTTWYQKSVRVVGEVLSLVSGKTYLMNNPPNSAIVDCEHGKITFEDDIADQYKTIFYHDGIEISQSDISNVDYINGSVTFNQEFSITGIIAADYSHTSDSTFTITPKPGKLLKINDAEIQFTKDVTMVPIKFEVWVNHPDQINNPGVKIPFFSRTYKNIRDIINVARQGKGFIPALDVITNDILVFPFAYDRKVILRDSLGAELRIYTVNHNPMVGEWGTITFYTVEENDIQI